LRCASPTIANRFITPERASLFEINGFPPLGGGGSKLGPALAISAREKGSDLWRTESSNS
jgi:hypothetical protein